MKQQNIIQRLCLFLFALVLTAPAWGYLDTWYASDRGKKEVEGTRTSRDGIVTVSWSNCKTGPAWFADNRNWEMKKGSTVTITCKPGYRVRAFYIEEQLKNASSLTCTSNKAYKGDGSKGIECSDATDNSITLSASEQVEFARYKVFYVQEARVRFDQGQYDVYILDNGITPALDNGGHRGHVSFRSTNDGVASVDYTGRVKFNFPGKATVIATYAATAIHPKQECSTVINVKRYQPIFTPTNDDDVFFTKGRRKGDDLASFYDYVKMTTESGHPYSHKNQGCSIISSNNAVLEGSSSTGKLTYGGTPGIATITISQTQNGIYEAASLSREFAVVRSDAQGTVLIKDFNEWKLFAHLVNNKRMTRLNARLEADITLEDWSAMVGAGENEYAGIFDGNGHSLILKWDFDNPYVAPFRAVSDATIKNLHIKGEITARRGSVAGLVNAVHGASTISNCTSSVDITVPGSGIVESSGLIWSVGKYGRATITDCKVSGTFKATNSNAKKDWVGFVFRNKGTCTISNSLYTGSNNADDSGHTFGENAKLSNCYYLNACGTPQGTPVTAEQLRNGEVAYLLQNRRGDKIWGQTLGTDSEPQLTSDAAKRVHKVDFAYNGKARTSRYATSGRGFFGSLPTIQEILGSEYDARHFYTLAFADDFSASTTVSGDLTVKATITEKDAYEIATKENWKTFCDLVDNGQTRLNGRLTGNIDLGSNLWMLGSTNHRYGGTLDGQGHTLSINWNTGDKNNVAPIQCVESATVKNLHTKGQITSAGAWLAGMILDLYGTTTLSNCVSEVDITSSYDKGYCAASGMVQCVRGPASATMSDCIVKGRITATTEKGRRKVAGFVCDQAGKCTLNNCLYLGSGNGHTWSKTFAENTTFNGCYYLNACGAQQGIRVTEKQLKNGYVAKCLQADRTDKCYWAQPLGEMPELYQPGKQTNYVYWNKDGQTWYCHSFEANGYLPVGLDFYAADATLKRSLAAGKPSTVTLPFDWHREGKAYALAAVNEEISTARFREVALASGENYEAYKPYLFVPKSDAHELRMSGIIVKAEPESPFKADPEKFLKVANKYVKWCATYAGMSNAKAVAANAYILQSDGKFHKVTATNANVVIPPYRAYFSIMRKVMGSKPFSLEFDDETTTGISTIETTDGDGTVRYYDLNGRYIGTSLEGQPKGIYIGNGKKVLKK